MKKINFLVTDIFYQQVKQTMEQLGIMNQSEFFRMSALHYINSRFIPKNDAEPRPSTDDLNHDEKLILLHLQKGPMNIDDLVHHTGFSVPKILELLAHLSLKKYAFQVGSSWRVL